MSRPGSAGHRADYAADYRSDYGSEYSSDAESRQGQGYRELWQRVSRVNPGESSALVTDCTVEDMLRTIKALHSKQSAVDVVKAGLPYLDSRALAFLLKELGKCKLTHRAFEIFDWLHIHPDDSLSALCDVFTYTTVISLCGSPRLLWKALRLVGCMKSKGIPCNTHTYSALISVCVKAKQPGLALDVYQEMKRVGCKPSVVTYNTLVDAYGKAGLWKEAVNVLESMVQEGIAPEPRTVNSVIRDCCECGQPDQGWQVYQRFMQTTAPTSATFQALITSFCIQGRVAEGLKVLDEQIAAGIDRTASSYAHLLHTAECSSSQLMLPILSYMRADNLALEEVRTAYRTALAERQATQQPAQASVGGVSQRHRPVRHPVAGVRLDGDGLARGPAMHNASAPIPNMIANHSTTQALRGPPMVGQPTLDDLQELLKAAQQQQHASVSAAGNGLPQHVTAQALGLTMPDFGELTSPSYDVWCSATAPVQLRGYNSSFDMPSQGSLLPNDSYHLATHYNPSHNRRL